MATLEIARLGYEGNLPPFDGATAWLNSEPLTPRALRGSVVLVDFWTLSCVNWIRTAPYLRAWDERYREHGLTVIGVHTPEFPFEHDVEGIRRAIEARGLRYPVAVDTKYALWDAFANRYWPAVYLADAAGALRFHHFGEGRYAETEAVIGDLLGLPAQEPVEVQADGIEAAADRSALGTPETYLGYDRGERFASPGPPALGVSDAYRFPARLRRDDWALSGLWTIGAKASRVDEAGGRLRFCFSARDVNLVMGPSRPAAGGAPVRFEVRLDGREPAAAAGADIDEHGSGSADERRLYQLIRQPGAVEERLLEITFLEPAVEVYVATFG